MADNKNKAAAIVAAVAVCAPVIAHFEGKRNYPYLDNAYVKTVCRGHTGGIIWGRRYTDAECETLFHADLSKHAEGVYACTPQIAERPEVFGAATSLAYNIGVARYCHSRAAALFRAGDVASGCKALGVYKMAGGKVLPGLVRRRAAEVRLCLRGL